MRAVLFAILILAIGGGAARAAGDAANGEKVYRQCRSCHAVGLGAKAKAGPELNGIIDRPWAADPGFAYSKAMKDGGAAGKRWSVEALALYLSGPKAFLPEGKKSLAGLKKPSDVEDVIAFLATFNADGSTK